MKNSQPRPRFHKFPMSGYMLSEDSYEHSWRPGDEKMDQKKEALHDQGYTYSPWVRKSIGGWYLFS